MSTAAHPLAGLKFAQLVVGAEEQAQLAALGISKTPALVALKGSDLSQRTLYEGERGWRGRVGQLLLLKPRRGSFGAGLLRSQLGAYAVGPP